MKYIKYTSYIVAGLLLLVGQVSYSQVDRSKLPEPATPRPIEIGDYDSFTLKNGLTVFVIQNNKLPRVTYRLQIDREPIMEGDKVGMLGMVGGLMRRGTTTRTKEQLDEEVDFLGASLSAGSSAVFASGLSKYSEKVLELMADMVLNPTFPEEELEKIRTQELSGIAQVKDDPDAISDNLSTALVYGNDHPYGEITTEESIKAVTAEDIRNYHDTYFRPNVAYLAVVGDIDTKTAKKLVTKYLGSWESGEVPAPTYKDPSAPEKNQVGIVNRSSSVQSVINVTYPVELVTGTEDVIPVRILNTILGGGSSARLFMNLREDKGYTYGAYSSLSSDDLVATFSAGASVRNEVTDSAVSEILFEMNRLISEEVSDEELELAKNSISGSFARSLENPQTVASFAINSKIYNLPDDYYATYIQKVQAVTKEDIKKMAAKYIKPENAYITIVGKAGEVAEGLTRFGEIKYYDEFGNEVDPSQAKLPEGLTAEQVIKDYFKAIGGKDAYEKFENLTLKMTAKMMGQELTMTQIFAKGLKSNVSMGMQGMTVMSSITDGEKASMTQMGQKPPLDEQTQEELLFANSLFGEFDLMDAGADLKLVGVEQINGREAYQIDVTLSKGANYSLFFDAETGLKVRYSKVMDTPRGAMTNSLDFSDYQSVDGMMVPFTTIQKVGPQAIESKVDEALLNQKLAEDTFIIK